MKRYSKNIVVKADDSIWMNGVQVKLESLRGDLVRQLVFEKSYITVHFHENASGEVYDKLTAGLKAEGFRDVNPVLYCD
jgi:hypothetical protein